MQRSPTTCRTLLFPPCRGAGSKSRLLHDELTKRWLQVPHKSRFLHGSDHFHPFFFFFSVLPASQSPIKTLTGCSWVPCPPSARGATPRPASNCPVSGFLIRNAFLIRSAALPGDVSSPLSSPLAPDIIWKGRGDEPPPGPQLPTAPISYRGECHPHFWRLKSGKRNSCLHEQIFSQNWRILLGHTLLLRH